MDSLKEFWLVSLQRCDWVYREVTELRRHDTDVQACAMHDEQARGFFGHSSLWVHCHDRNLALGIGQKP